MPSPKRPDDAGSPHWLETARKEGGYATLGWQIAGTLVTFVGIGIGLDLWLETAPWFILAGTAVALASVFAQLWRVNAEMTEASNRRRARKAREERS
jgi:F0F1-type ATP synthase assembly protein I